jgi:hypothetical protein
MRRCTMAKKALMVLALLSIPTMVLAQQQPHPYYAVRLAACKGKAAGDACSFQGPGGNVSATCHTSQRSDLVCGSLHRH